MEKSNPLRFGAEFGPKGVENPSGVSLSTFKTLVWVSNIGGLILFAIGLEIMVVQQSFGIGLALLIAGVKNLKEIFLNILRDVLNVSSKAHLICQ